METLGNKLVAKSGKTPTTDYYCEKCDYKCSKIYNWKKHLDTAKHIYETNGSVLETQSSKKWQNGIIFCEKCNKEFKTRSGLWKHSKTCNFNDKKEVATKNITTSNEIQELKEIMKYLLKENSEMKNIMMDVNKTGTHNTTNNTTNNTNSHNKTFNLNFFLNETCKDALNINDFVSSIKVSLDDLENTGRQGYIEGISHIILNKLKNLNHYDRPIHCADQKREILYIKNDNQWIKESEEKPLLTKAIKTIANENIKQIKTWRDNNPEYTDSYSKKNNLYLKIVSNSMIGTDKEECDKNINKIIKNIVKETIIDK